MGGIALTPWHSFLFGAVHIRLERWKELCGHVGHGGHVVVWLSGGGTGRGSCTPGRSWVLLAAASAARRQGRRGATRAP